MELAILVTDGTSFGVLESLYTSLELCKEAIKNVSSELTGMGYDAYCVPHVVLNYDMIRGY